MIYILLTYYTCIYIYYIHTVHDNVQLHIAEQFQSLRRGTFSDETIIKVSEMELTEELQLLVLSYYVFDHKKT